MNPLSCGEEQAVAARSHAHAFPSTSLADIDTPRPFQTTRWTLVEAASSGEPARRAQAAAELAAICMPPILATLLSHGLRADEARELAQAFYAEVVLARGLMGRARRERGTLRGYIKASLANFRVELHRRAQSRGGAVVHLDIDGHVTTAPSVAAPSASDVGEPDTFDRAWAAEVLSQALARTERYCHEHGLQRHWELLSRCRLHPALRSLTPPSVQALADELGFGKPADASAALQYVNGRVRRLLGEVLAEAGCDSAEDQAAAVAALRAGAGVIRSHAVV